MSGRLVTTVISGSLSTRVSETRTKIRHARAVLTSRFLYHSSLMKERYLVMWIWFCHAKLKLKITNFWLPSASQKRACLSPPRGRGLLYCYLSNLGLNRQLPHNWCNQGRLFWTGFNYSKLRRIHGYFLADNGRRFSVHLWRENRRRRVVLDRRRNC